MVINRVYTIQRERERERESVIDTITMTDRDRERVRLTVTSVDEGCTSVAFLGSGNAPISNAQSDNGEVGQRIIFTCRSNFP